MFISYESQHCAFIFFHVFLSPISRNFLICIHKCLLKWGLKISALHSSLILFHSNLGHLCLFRLPTWYPQHKDITSLLPGFPVLLCQLKTPTEQNTGNHSAHRGCCSSVRSLSFTAWCRKSTYYCFFLFYLIDSYFQEVLNLFPLISFEG